MKRFKLNSVVLIIGCFLVISSCKKENSDPEPTPPPSPECEVNHTSTIRILNTESQPFYVYVQYEYIATVNPNETVDVGNISIGTKSVQFLNVADNNDLREVTIEFLQCTIHPVEL